MHHSAFFIIHLKVLNSQEENEWFPFDTLVPIWTWIISNPIWNEIIGPTKISNLSEERGIHLSILDTNFAIVWNSRCEAKSCKSALNLKYKLKVCFVEWLRINMTTWRQEQMHFLLYNPKLQNKILCPSTYIQVILVVSSHWQISFINDTCMQCSIKKGGILYLYASQERVINVAEWWDMVRTLSYFYKLNCLLTFVPI